MFPEVSAITSSAAAILVSPILGSYERVCIGAVSIIDGDVEVGIIGLTEPISKMGEIIRLVAEQLKEHLVSGGLLAEFKPMAAGFFVGPEVRGQFGTHKRAIQTILRNNSFLYRGQNV